MLVPVVRTLQQVPHLHQQNQRAPVGQHKEQKGVVSLAIKGDKNEGRLIIRHLHYKELIYGSHNVL